MTTHTPEELVQGRPRPRRFQPHHYSTGGLKQTFKLSRTEDQSRPSKQSKAIQCDFSPDLQPGMVTLSDLQLLHNFTISTYKTMRDEDPNDVWQKHLVEWGIEFPSILHLILALSALHLGYKQPALRDKYIQQADDHFTFGVRSVTAVLSQLSADNCQKVYLSAVLICFIYFGRGPRPGEYLIFSDNGPAEWLVLMHGVKVVTQSYHEKVFSGLLEPKNEKQVYTLTTGLRTKLDEHTIHIEAIRRLVDQEASDEANRQMYSSAIEDLVSMMREVFDRMSAGKSGVSLTDLLIGWLYRRPEEMVRLFEQKDPCALIILAHWAMLLKHMESAWFMEGWAIHVVLGVSRSLQSEYRPWIEWPLRQAH